MPVLQTLRSCWRNAADESTWVNTGICTRLTCSRSALQLHKNRRTATDKGHTHTHTHMHVRASCIPDGCHLARCSRDLHLNRCFGVTQWSLIIQHDTGARFLPFHTNQSTNNANTKRNIAERAAQPQSWRIAADEITQLSL